MPASGDDSIFSSGSSSSSEPEECNSTLYFHHLLVIEVIDETHVHVIHKRRDKGVVEEKKQYSPRNVTFLDYDSPYTGQEAIQRAHEIKGKSEEYTHHTSNCEHFVTETRTGEKQSRQIQGAELGRQIRAARTAVGGALIGAGIGSIVPVAGTAVGGVVGAIIGGVVGLFVGGTVDKVAAAKKKNICRWTCAQTDF